MITVVGAGSIGSIIANRLSKEHEVKVVDPDTKALENVDSKMRLPGRIEDHAEVLDKSDAVVVALPGSVAFPVVRKLVSEGRRVVDISFSPENPLELSEVAEKNGGLLIPDAGFAPGLTNLIAGSLYSEKKYSAIEMYVAGLPEEPSGPLQYTVTWSVEGLIDEYTRPARIIRHGKEISLDPLDEPTCYNIEGVGQFEAFYSDGLRTLMEKLKGVDMFEKTLRYPGHLDRMRFLRDLGFFSSEEVAGVQPRMLTGELIREAGSGERDFCVLIVRGVGSEVKEYRCIDHYDRTGHITSMSRMTGFTAAAFAGAVAEGKISGRGVVTPEELGMDHGVFSLIREKLSETGIVF